MIKGWYELNKMEIDYFRSQHPGELPDDLIRLCCQFSPSGRLLWAQAFGAGHAPMKAGTSKVWKLLIDDCRTEGQRIGR